MWKQILPGLRIKMFLTIVLGVAYPLAGDGNLTAYISASGQREPDHKGDQVIGSELIGQNFHQARIFSATAVGGRKRRLRSTASVDKSRADQSKANRSRKSVGGEIPQRKCRFYGPIPADMLTGSRSGLDPDISPASAQAQAARVAKARGISVDQVNQLIAQYTKTPDLGLLGEPRVNVLKLNLALDQQYRKQ